MTPQNRIHPTVLVEDEGKVQRLFLAVHHTTLGPVHVDELEFSVQRKREGGIEGDRLQLRQQGNLFGRELQNGHVPVL